MDLSNFNARQREMVIPIIQMASISRVWFVKHVLRVENIEPWQLEELKALDKGATKVSIKSGHGIGKTTFCSWLALHYVLFRDDVKVIVTSPSQKQMDDGLIPEIQKWIAKLPKWMADQLDSTATRITRSPNVKNNFISFRTARKENPEALAGIHASNVLIIVDEASGVDDVIYETGQGSLSTEGAIAVLIGNPTKPSGFFHDTHTKLSDLWRCRTVACQDSSRVTPEYISGIARSYGIRSREYRVRVLGLFPLSGVSAIIPTDYLRRAQGRNVAKGRGDLVWGVDVGRGGDPSALIERDDFSVYDMLEYHLDDTMDLVKNVNDRYEQTDPRIRPARIYVDTVGVGGPVYDRLKELGLPVVAVAVSTSSSMGERFHRLRDELWYDGRDWFETMQVRLPTNNENSLADQLVTELGVVQSSDESGKIKVESKKQMRARGVKSTNLADALLLTFSKSALISSGTLGDKFKGVDTSAYRAPHVV